LGKREFGLRVAVRAIPPAGSMKRRRLFYERTGHTGAGRDFTVDSNSAEPILPNRDVARGVFRHDRQHSTQKIFE